MQKKPNPQTRLIFTFLMQNADRKNLCHQNTLEIFYNRFAIKRAICVKATLQNDSTPTLGSLRKL